MGYYGGPVCSPHAFRVVTERLGSKVEKREKQAFQGEKRVMKAYLFVALLLACAARFSEGLAGFGAAGGSKKVAQLKPKVSLHRLAPMSSSRRLMLLIFLTSLLRLMQSQWDRYLKVSLIHVSFQVRATYGANHSESQSCVGQEQTNEAATLS